MSEKRSPISGPVCLYLEVKDGELTPGSLSALAMGQSLVKEDEAGLLAILIGQDSEDEIQALAFRHALNLEYVKLKNKSCQSGTEKQEILSSLLSEKRAEVLLAPQSSQVLDFLPALSKELGWPCLCGVEWIKVQDRGLLFEKKVLAGKYVAHFRAKSKNFALTVQPKASPKYYKDEQAKVCFRNWECRTNDLELLGKKKEELKDVGLNKAQAVLSVGRGINWEENKDEINELLSLLPKSALGCSRPLCDLGILDYAHQVGMTGQRVSPKVYLALGISGALQHLAGMQDSGFVAAVNQDPQAAIFNHADLKIVAEAGEFVQALLAELKESTS